ncbi:hypothetical protein HK104_007284, partial [Borealophlyctis nickersoniae]
FNPDTNILFTDITYAFHPLIFPLPNKARVVTVFHLKPIYNRDGTSIRHYLIHKQEDIYPLDQIPSYCIPEPIGSLVWWGIRKTYDVIGFLTVNVSAPLVKVVSYTVEGLGIQNYHNRVKD